MIPIGEWVLRDACRQAAGWRTSLPGAGDVWLSVNLSARQVVQCDLVDTVRGNLHETGIPADRLLLEVTGSVMLMPGPAAADHLFGLVTDGADRR